MKWKTKHTLLLLAAAVLMSSATRSKPGMAQPVGGLEEQKRKTGGPSWASDRYAALLRMGISGDVARAIVAHWHVETDGGAGEWNFNVGNIIASAGDRMIKLDTSDGTMWFRSFGTLDAGVAAYLALLRGRYAECWAELQSSPSSTQWVRCLAQHGYAGKESPDEYASAWAGRLARV